MRLLFSVPVVLFVAGCIPSLGNARIADEALVAKIEKGRTTKEGVKELIGKPTVVDFTDSGLEKWAYAYYPGGYRGNGITLTILFDKGGVVMNHGGGEFNPVEK